MQCGVALTTDSKAIQEHSVYLKIIMEAIRSNFRRILFSTVSISCSQNLSAQCTDKSRIHIANVYISHILHFKFIKHVYEEQSYYKIPYQKQVEHVRDQRICCQKVPHHHLHHHQIH